MISIIEKKLYQYCNELNMQIQELSIILSFSGGIDSTVLASLLIELRDKFEFELILIHFNHNTHEELRIKNLQYAHRGLSAKFKEIVTINRVVASERDGEYSWMDIM